ncbi:MAG TPA: UDP-N-acetylglucosamine 2-epimerase (non-hydrolyzing) [Terriglobales bacterium]|nr:UDP-N-acetylglucosamine 2-epimerase (non-hydrolyzing) [Terriglobales bacterium]
MVNKRLRVGVVFGTRPEAIKLAPVISELNSRLEQFQPFLISTAQHRSMLDQVMNVFGIAPHVDLDLMQPNQTLNSLTCRVLQAMDSVLLENPLDALVVQGDTTTAFAAALAAFYRRVPVAHVEAGLRSRDIANPFPEEVNRRLAGVVTALHCAPTSIARENLLAEGIPAEQIVTTGNTVVDAVKMLVDMQMADQPLPTGVPDDGSRILLITSHRRESWGTELENICDAIREIVTSFSDVRAIYPVHMNPNVRETVMARLGNLDRVHLIEPVDYFGFLSLLRRCYLVLTDSGGVQEEAPTFGKPVLVLRKVTERPEASMMGLARIVGTTREAIVREANDILSSTVVYRTMSEGANPYGDGRASQRIVESLWRWMNGATPVLDLSQQFDNGVKEQIATVAL